MATLLDRLKEVAKPLNTIEAVQEQAQQARPDLHGANPTQPQAAPAQPQTAPPVEAKKAKDEPKSAAYATEPEAISKAYYVEQRGSERRYFDDYKKTALAIRADDSSINSKREDLNTIRAMLTMAESRGWQEVKVNGSAEFKRETWIEASSRGITAQGYKASDTDRQEADRRRAEQGKATPQGPAKLEGNEIRQTAAPVAATPSPSSPAVAAPTAPQAPTQQNAGAEKQAQAPAPSSPAVAAPTALQTPMQQNAGAEKQAPGATPASQEATPTRADNRKALRDATAELSPDGRIILAAVSEKIDREMNRMSSDNKAELKAYFATTLAKKETVEGPVVLSNDQKRTASAPEPVPQQKAPEPERQPERLITPEEPRLSRTR